MAAAGPYETAIRNAAPASIAPPGERLRFSESLLRLVALGGGERITVGEIVEALGDRAFGAVLLIFAAPNVFPLAIPGTSAVTAVPICIAALQLLLGRRVLRLPAFVAARSLAKSDFTRVVERLLPWIGRAERRVRPAWPAFVSASAERIAGLVCLLMGIILFFPIPLGNLVPGIAVVLIGLGVMERDGRAVMLGHAVAFVATAVVLVVLGGLVGAFLFVVQEVTEV